MLLRKNFTVLPQMYPVYLSSSQTQRILGLFTWVTVLRRMEKGIIRPLRDFLIPIYECWFLQSQKAVAHHPMDISPFSEHVV